MNTRAGLRVLVLDDEPLMLKAATHLLRVLGVGSSVSCDSAGRALAEIDGPGGPPDLILLDLNMPVMDGLEFVRHLGERRYDGSLILVSGEDRRVLQTAERLVEAHGIHVLGHVDKPITRDRLQALLDAWQPHAAHAAGRTATDYNAAALTAAIANGELINYYQPKVRVRDGELTGVEALVRWQHPRDGLVPPNRFIGLAERYGLIEPLTRAVLSEALRQLGEWQQASLALNVAVNVSMQSFGSLEFAEFVVAETAAIGVAPQNVTLEVTESQLMTDLRTPLEVLARLRVKRFGLAIDDFGTGHSSLAQLRDIPFNELKIDRSFVHKAAVDPTLRAIYDASLSLAKQLGLDVVAEGVEDADDWDLLTRTGCDYAQGFHIARPMPGTALLGWLQRRRAST